MSVQKNVAEVVLYYLRTHTVPFETDEDGAYVFDLFKVHYSVDWTGSNYEWHNFVLFADNIMIEAPPVKEIHNHFVEREQTEKLRREKEKQALDNLKLINILATIEYYK